jgi:two-component system, LytTR family, sensor kinase
MSKKSLYWVCQIGGWSLFVLSQSLFFKLENAFTTNVAISQFMMFVFGIAVSHLYRNIIIRFNWIRIKTIFLIPRVIITTLVLATVMDYTQYGIELGLNIAGAKHQDFVTISTNILNLTFVFFFWSLIYFSFHYIENYKKAEIENLKWAASINEIELNKLKSQLNPHFMFNAMNSIRALVDENPVKSKEAITQLSNILRNTLQMGKNKVIPFSEEIKVVNDYLSLEAIRYEERLKASVSIDQKSDEFNVPPLMIQTLVENGIKHGISKLTEGGILEVKTFVKEGKLHILIKNSGHINGSLENDNGFGIKNTLQRLMLLYGKQATLKIENGTQNTVLTELVIPKNSLD